MKNFTFTVIALLLTNFAFSQIQDTIWTKTIGGSGNEPNAYNFESKTNTAINNEGEIYMLTNTISTDIFVNNSYGNQDCWLVKLNTAGDTLWTKVFGGTSYDAATSLIAMPDGGCVAAGFTYSNDNDFTGNHDSDGSRADGFITRFSTNGEISWTNLYGGGGAVGGIDELTKIMSTINGNLYAVGRSSSINGDLPFDLTKFMGAWLLEVDATNGDVIQSNKIAGLNHNELNANNLYDIKQLPDESGYIAIGTQTYIFPDKLWLVKIDNNADTVWTKEFVASDNDNFPRGIEIDTQGNFIISSWITAGGTNITDAYGASDCWILKTNDTGEEIAQATYGGSEGELIYGIKSDNLGGFFVYGATSSSDYYALGQHYGISDFWLVNFDSNLDTLCTYKIGGSDSDAIQDIAVSEDGRYIYATGKTASNDFYVSNNNGGNDVWISKIEKFVPVNIETQIQKSFSFYPNPSSAFIIIEQMQNKEIIIYDISGRAVLSKTINSEKQKIRLNNLSNGVYFIKSDSYSTQKMIKF